MFVLYQQTQTPPTTHTITMPKTQDAPKMSSHLLSQKAAGYLLAAGNAAKMESQSNASSKSNQKNKK
jgi:hypothetical protein